MLFCKEEVPLSFLENHQKTCKIEVENNVKIEKALNESKVQFPKEWDTMKAANNLELFISPINSEDFKLKSLLIKFFPQKCKQFRISFFGKNIIEKS